MPVLNKDKCYKKKEIRLEITAPKEPPKNWLQEFYDLLAAQLQLNDTKKEEFINEFNRHVGPKSTYTYKSQLLESLRKLYCIYTHENTNVDQQHLIASRIYEDSVELRKLTQLSKHYPFAIVLF